MKKIFLCLVAFGLLANQSVLADNGAKGAATAVAKPGSNGSILYVKEGDLTKIEAGKNLRKVIEAFEAKLRAEDAKVREKLSAEFSKLSQSDPDYKKKVNALQTRLELHQKKMQNLHSKAMAEMQRAAEELQTICVDVFKSLCKKYGTKSILKAESVFAFLDEENSEYLDVTSEFIKMVNQKKTNIEVKLPLIN